MLSRSHNTRKNSNAGGSNKIKSSLCRKYSENGYCPYGIKCQFAHGLEELRCNVDENSYKTKVCNSFLKKSYCSYGLRCNFAHNIPKNPVNEEQEMSEKTVFS